MQITWWLYPGIHQTPRMSFEHYDADGDGEGPLGYGPSSAKSQETSTTLASSLPVRKTNEGV